jgi:hypothetical protein
VAARGLVCFTDQQTMTDNELSGQERTDDERRAEWERFTTVVLSGDGGGYVNVRNDSQANPNEHIHTVHVENGEADGCSCPHAVYRDAHCKHQVAVEQRPLVVSSADAASATTATTGQQVATDGGQVIEDTNDTDDSDDTTDSDTHEWDDPPLPEIADRLREAFESPELDNWEFATHRDLTEASGFVRVSHTDAQIAMRIYDAISVSFDVSHADPERRSDRVNSNWRSESSVTSPDEALTVARELNDLTLERREEIGTKWLARRALAGEVSAETDP